MVWTASRRGGRCQGPAGPNRARETHGKPGQTPALQRAAGDGRAPGGRPARIGQERPTASRGRRQR